MALRAFSVSPLNHLAAKYCCFDSSHYYLRVWAVSRLEVEQKEAIFPLELIYPFLTE
jgi:hypothetical protein